jgi:hypothetical protein
MTELGFDTPMPDEYKRSELSSKSGDELESSGARWTTQQGCPEGWPGGANQWSGATCGTGGFLLAAHNHISQLHKLDPAEMKHLRTAALRGTDIVPGVVSLCAMNLYLHGIGSAADAQKKNDPPIDRADALAQPSNLGPPDGLPGRNLRRSPPFLNRPELRRCQPATPSAP